MLKKVSCCAAQHDYHYADRGNRSAQFHLVEPVFYLGCSFFFFSFPFFQLGRETSGSPNNGSVANLLGSSSSGSLFLDVQVKTIGEQVACCLIAKQVFAGQ